MKTMVRVPRKLKKEKNKIEIHSYPYIKDKNGFIKEEVVIFPNVKINKWTLKLVFKIKRELENRNKYIWKTACEDFFKV